MKARLTAGAALALLVLALAPATSSPAFPGSTFVVNSSADGPGDPLPGDGTCDTLQSPFDATCTLRAAIEESNGHTGADNITFLSNLGPIAPLTPLPLVIDQVEIDGNDGFGGRTEIDGSSLTIGTPNGLEVGTAQGSFVENLAIKGFAGVGLRLLGPATVGNCTIFVNGDAGIELGPGPGGGVFQTSASQNGGPGIRVLAGPVTISGTSATGNGGDGIEVVSGSGVNISGGSFLGNADLGIDLNADGVTPNDAGDADTGPNGLQNFPVLTSATTTGGRPQPGSQTVVNGTLDTAGPVTVRLYSNESCDPSGNGEGLSPIGEQSNVGSGPFTITLPDVGADIVTATATDSGGNTSEFSNCITAVLVGADLGVTKTASPGAGAGEFVTTGNQIQYLVTVSNAGPDAATNVSLSDQFTGAPYTSFVSATPSQGSCGTPDANSVFSCQLGSIAANASATIDIRVTATLNSTTIVPNHVFGLDADQTDPVCTLEPVEPGQSDPAPCDGAAAATRIEPADGQAGGFVGPGDTLSTGTTATASDPTVFSLTNNGGTGTDATLVELGCPGSGDPLCSDPNIVGSTLDDVSIGGTSAAAGAATSAAPTQPAPFTARLLYDKSILPPVRLQAIHVYKGTTRLAGCSRKVPPPCVSSLKLLSGSKDLEAKVALLASARLRTTTS